MTVIKKPTTWKVLRNKFPQEEYVLLAEVPDHVGNRNRYLDFMLINLWSSRGLSIVGIEQKSNRGDWLKEVKNPKKQESHFKHCDFFYLLTDKEGVAKLDEIPVTWGWFHITDKGMLKTMKAAPKLQSEPVPRALLCGMLRRAADKAKYVHVDSIEDQIVQQAASMQQSKQNQLERDSREYISLLEKVEAFEKFSGLNIKHAYAPWMEKMGAAVRVIESGGVEQYIKKVEEMGEQLKKMHEGIVKNISILKNEQQGNTDNSGN